MERPRSFADLAAEIDRPLFGARSGPAPELSAFSPHAAPQTPAVIDTHGTTVIAVKYRDGVLNVGDRRATAAMSVMYDQAEKVVPLDDFTLIAVSGSFARAMEIIRYLKHSFKYYARTQ